MQISEAITFLKGLEINHPNPQNWADLGCGGGTFTKALAAYLTSKSVITAVDEQNHRIENEEDIRIDFLKANFEKDGLPFDNLDGILMANSFHFINDKSTLVEKLSQLLKANGQFAIIEYDSDVPNAWVPYPISFSSLQQLFMRHGYKNSQKIAERDSIFGRQKMYFCSIRKERTITI